MFCSAQQCQSHFAVIWNGEEYGCAGMCAEMRIRCCRPSSVDDYATPSSACPAVGGTTLRVRAIDGPDLSVCRNGPSQRGTQMPSHEHDLRQEQRKPSSNNGRKQRFFDRQRILRHRAAERPFTMKTTPVSRLDRLLAGVCRNCPVCRTARRRQSGFAHWLVRRVESTACPFCRAYERVYGRKAYEKTQS